MRSGRRMFYITIWAFFVLPFSVSIPQNPAKTPKTDRVAKIFKSVRFCFCFEEAIAQSNNVQQSRIALMEIGLSFGVPETAPYSLYMRRLDDVDRSLRDSVKKLGILLFDIDAGSNICSITHQRCNLSSGLLSSLTYMSTAESTVASTQCMERDYRNSHVALGVLEDVITLEIEHLRLVLYTSHRLKQQIRNLDIISHLRGQNLSAMRAKAAPIRTKLNKDAERIMALTNRLCTVRRNLSSKQLKFVETLEKLEQQEAHLE